MIRKSIFSVIGKATLYDESTETRIHTPTIKFPKRFIGTINMLTLDVTVIRQLKITRMKKWGRRQKI